MDLTPNASPATVPAKPSRAARVWRRLRNRLGLIFALTVVAPTAAASLYFGLIASDVYVSESRFVVRSPQRQTQSALGALLQTTGFSRSQDDTYSVHDFVLSRDALEELEHKLDIRRAFSAPAIDRFNRFPSLDFDSSFEALHRHYRKHVGINYDTVSSISTLLVRAYTAEQARAINDLLLQMGERLVNNLNDRSRKDLIVVAEKEVAAAEERAKAASIALSGYRNRNAIFDPERQSALLLQSVAKLQEELLATETQLAQLRSLSPDNPQVPALKMRVDSLRKSIASESAKISGEGGSFSAKASGFDRLVLDKTFADRQLAAAMSALESARNEAQRKQLYLERLVQPNLPDKAVEPRRIRGVLTVLLVGLVLWGVVSLVVASIREHTD